MGDIEDLVEGLVDQGHGEAEILADNCRDHGRAFSIAFTPLSYARIAFWSRGDTVSSMRDSNAQSRRVFRAFRKKGRENLRLFAAQLHEWRRTETRIGPS